MAAITSLPLMHSWPLYEAALRLPLGNGLADMEDGSAPMSHVPDSFAAQGIGLWHCDLRDNALRWSPVVHELFGLPQDEPLDRALTVSRYMPASRREMEELRAYAIRHRRGFTLDVRIRRLEGGIRWMRLSALPLVSGKRVVRLCGTKQDVTAEYDGAG